MYRFVSIVLFYVLFVCKCVLYYCHRVLTQLQLNIHRIVSYPIVPYRIISYHIMSYHIISYHIISYHIISYHIISYHISYHIISYHIISYHIISSLSWDITRRVLVVRYRRFGTTYHSLLQESSILAVLGLLDFVDQTDSIFRNVSNHLPIHDAWHPTTAKIWPLKCRYSPGLTVS